MHQAWLELGGQARGSRFAFRAGRQEIALGNERLIGAANWTNTGRSFGGARVMAARNAAWSATAFAATGEERGRRAPTARQRDGGDYLLLAAQAQRGGLEGLVVHDRNAAFRAYSDVERTTWYGRTRAPLTAAINLDVEAAWQYGAQEAAIGTGISRDQRIGAWLTGARVVRPATPQQPLALTVGVDVLSGDDDPLDGSYRAFNTLYATSHIYYGLMDLLLDPAARTRDRGLVDALARASLRVSPSVTVRTDLHAYRLATGADRDLGMEWNVISPIRVDDVAHLELGYALFRAGSAAESLGLGARGAIRHWSYVQLRAFF